MSPTFCNLEFLQFNILFGIFFCLYWCAKWLWLLVCTFSIQSKFMNNGSKRFQQQKIMWSLVFCNNVCVCHSLWREVFCTLTITNNLIFFLVINRPGVAGAVLQTLLSMIDSLIQSTFSSKPSKHQYTQSVRARELKFWKKSVHSPPHVTCHVSCVRCQVSGVRCLVSNVRCQMSHFFLKTNMVEIFASLIKPKD